MFSMSHTSSIMTVKAGKVDLAAITTTSLRNMIAKGRVAEGDVRVIWESEPIMASIIAVRRSLPTDFKSELLAAYPGLSLRRSRCVGAYRAALPSRLASGRVAASDRDFDSLRALARGVKHLDLIP
jgi:phosphonate transport system substrate-binding protein